MVERGRGSIIGFSSIRGTTVEPGQGVYAATKAGLVQLFRTAAAEFGPAGVRVNAIAPGVVETPLTAQIKANADWYDAYARKGRARPLGAAGGTRRRRGLPGFGRVDFRDRLGARGRRRLDRRRRPLRPACFVKEERMTELPDLTAVELVAAFRAGTVSPVEVTEAVLDRIEAREPELHALYALRPVVARERSRRSPRRAGRRASRSARSTAFR